MKTRSSLLPESCSKEQFQNRLNAILDALEQDQLQTKTDSEQLILQAAELTGFCSDWALTHCLAGARFSRRRATGERGESARNSPKTGLTSENLGDTRFLRCFSFEQRLNNYLHQS